MNLLVKADAKTLLGPKSDSDVNALTKTNVNTLLQDKSDSDANAPIKTDVNTLLQHREEPATDQKHQDEKAKEDDEIQVHAQESFQQ